MALRKASAYSKKKYTPYTRKSNVKSKSYIKTIPPIKTVKFRMGDLKGFVNKKYPIFVSLVAGENILIRDNALEASRQYIHKKLEKELSGQYFFEIKVYPHHILRENKTLTGAGADRLSSGMSMSFGSVIGRAAPVEKNQKIFLIAVNSEKSKAIAIKILEKVKAKLPCHSRILIEKL